GGVVGLGGGRRRGRGGRSFAPPVPVRSRQVPPACSWGPRGRAMRWCSRRPDDSKPAGRLPPAAGGVILARVLDAGPSRPVHRRRVLLGASGCRRRPAEPRPCLPSTAV